MDARVHPAEFDLVPARVRRLLGGRCGIVTGLLQYLPDRTDPAVYYSTGIETDVGRLAGTDAAGLEAGGTGLGCAKSLLRTLGEAAERYCLYFPDRDEILEGSHAEVAARHATVDFEFINVYDPERRSRVGLNPLAPETPIHWQPTRNLLTGNPVFVPAEWIWLGAIDPATERSLPTTSSGCACGPSRTAAALGALEEYVEGDAIMRTWYQQRSPRPTAVPPDAETASVVDDRLEADRLDIRFFEIDGPTGVPTVGCAMFDTGERAPKFAVGGAHALDRREAYLGAFLEVAQTWVYLKDLVLREPDGGIDPDHTTSRTTCDITPSPSGSTRSSSSSIGTRRRAHRPSNAVRGWPRVTPSTPISNDSTPKGSPRSPSMSLRRTSGRWALPSSASSCPNSSASHCPRCRRFATRNSPRSPSPTVRIRIREPRRFVRRGVRDPAPTA